MFGRRFKIKKLQKEIEPQEVLLDSFAQKREKELGFSERKLETPLSQKILQGLWLVFFILTFLLLGRTAQLQILEGEHFRQLAEENRFVIRQIQAQRGVIYDKNLKQLVFNKPSFDLFCLKSDLPQEQEERDNILQEVARILEKDNEELKKEISEAKEPEILIAENLAHQTLILLEARRYNLPGFEVRNNTVRDYLDGSLFSHLIGYQRKTGQNSGLEEYYNENLQAKSGELYVKRDVHGNAISKEIVSLPESGQSLILHLDAGLQEKISQFLESSIRNVGANSGTAVALDPKTGGVLALVSFPKFDNNLFSQGMSEEDWLEIKNNPDDPLFNRAIAGKYLTGSTIKPLIASAALEEEIIEPKKNIYCAGRIIIPNPWIANASTTKKDWMMHGWTDMRKAIAESCNVYFYTIGGGYENQQGLGPTRIKEYLELFGWGDKTGIDLPGESEGFIPDKDWKKETWGQGWWDGDTYNLAIGQGFLQITPLEVALAFSAIANGGILYEPKVVKEIIDSEKNLIEEIKPEIIRQNFITPSNLQIVREGMRQAVTGAGSPHASAVLLNSLPVSAAAKTGTAELGNDYYHNWVTVFAPYDNPQIVLTVMIEKVKKEQVAALPVAKEVLAWYFSE